MIPSVLLCLAVGEGLWAQQDGRSGTPPGDGSGAPRGGFFFGAPQDPEMLEKMIGAELAVWNKHLTLTDAQREKVSAIILDYYATMRQLAQAETRPTMEQLQAQTEAKSVAIHALLSAKQQAIMQYYYDTINQEIAEAIRQALPGGERRLRQGVDPGAGTRTPPGTAR